MGSHESPVSKRTYKYRTYKYRGSDMYPGEEMMEIPVLADYF